MDLIFQLSQLLNTGLDRATLTILVGLCECGVNPSALALVVKELRREATAVDIDIQPQQPQPPQSQSHTPH